MQLDAIIKQCQAKGLNSLELAHFLAQCDHESAGFTKVIEGSNYRYSTARNVFSAKYHGAINSKQVELKAKNDDFIPQPFFFDLVYGSRMGNNGNGYKYRGRGYIQITGHDNYQAYAKYSGCDAVNSPDLLCNEVIALDSAIWFWGANNCGKVLDIEVITRKINGGLNGLTERKKLLDKYVKLL